MKGPALLTKYLRDTQQRPADFAGATGLSEGWLSRILRGIRKPDIDNATLIERATDNAVPATSWASHERRRKKQRSA